VRYAFVKENTSAHAIATLCRTLALSRSGYYAWATATPSQRSVEDERLRTQITQLHDRSRGAYGALKTWQALRQAGVCVGKHRVARLRLQAGIKAKRKRRFRKTVEHRQLAHDFPDLLNRQFSAAAPDKVWVGDMTFIRTRQGWHHLAILMDVYSRCVVGWAFGDRPNAKLHENALRMAISQRRPKKGLIHHTDRGVQYRSASYRALTQKAGIVQSMSGRKSAYDNAMAESFFSTLKNEWMHHRDLRTREQSEAEGFDFIELYYNRQRIHQSLGYKTPVQFEAQCAQQIRNRRKSTRVG
jgi:putative transposase